MILILLSVGICCVVVVLSICKSCCMVILCVRVFGWVLFWCFMMMILWLVIFRCVNWDRCEIFMIGFLLKIFKCVLWLLWVMFMWIR